MQIQSEQLLLRPFFEEDYEDYVYLRLENSYSKEFDEANPELVRDSIRATLDKTSDENFSIFKMPECEYCGNVSLQKGPTTGNPEIGIELLKSCQNQGIGTAAISLFCKYCFEQRGITRFEVRIDPENKRSIHVFEKLGAQFESKQPDYIVMLKKLYEKYGQTLPDDLDENVGTNHYYLELPLKG